MTSSDESHDGGRPKHHFEPIAGTEDHRALVAARNARNNNQPTNDEHAALTTRPRSSRNRQAQDTSAFASEICRQLNIETFLNIPVDLSGPNQRYNMAVNDGSEAQMLEAVHLGVAVVGKAISHAGAYTYSSRRLLKHL